MGMGINLHAVVRGAITAVHPDEACTLYQSIGQQNIKGTVVPVYAEGKTVRANFQPLDTDALKHLEAMNDTEASEQVFLYSDVALPVTGQQRLPLTRTGDFLGRSDGTYWLVTSVLEDWSQDGWCNVGVHRQTTPPDFSASAWYVPEEVQDGTP